MKKIRVGINGFGRMGRLALRAAWDWEELEIVHINEISGNAVCSAHLLEYDSVHGRWRANQIGADEKNILIDGQSVGYSMIPDPAQVGWDKIGAELVMECSGEFKTPETLQSYFDHGVKKVVVSAPVKQGALNVVMGINDALYDPHKHRIVTAASCTTNCLAPVIQVILENLGIRHATMTTIHNITNTQTIIDKGHKDLRRARACGMSLIPTSTGSARAITQIFPELTGKIDGWAVRIPLLNASLTDMAIEVTCPTSVAEVNGFLKQAALGSLKGILGYEELPLVSIDYNNDTRSSIVDALSTMVIDGTLVKIFAWYDNEVGYANRLAELTRKVARSL